MATSGTTAFNLDVADLIEDAYERIGIEPNSGNDLRTARRSLNILLQSFSNDQINLWKTILTTQTVTQGTASYTLDDKTIDVKDVVIRRDSNDVRMNRISRQQYQSLPNKATQGRPVQYWLERLLTPVLHIWPAPENSTDELRFYALERIEDVGAYTNTIDAPVRFHPAIISGLAFHLAVKKKPEVAQAMKALFDQDLANAQAEDRDRASLFVNPGRR